jgi:hypothetical protein
MTVPLALAFSILRRNMGAAAHLGALLSWTFSSLNLAALHSGRQFFMHDA